MAMNQLLLTYLEKENAMRDINVKVSKAVNAESDLEEGEIPEFEVSSFGIDEGKDVLLSGKGESSNCIKSQDNSNYNQGQERHDSPPSEGECISDEEKWISKNEMLPKDTYENNLAGRRPKYMRPFQSTYGCVQDIMTKIGESLGRNSNYYKNRRVKETRHIFNVNNDRDVNSQLRESSPVLERLRYNNCKRGRYRETKVDYTSNVRNTFEKMKYRRSLNDRKIGQEIMKKRKREDDEFVQDETSKKYKVLNQKGNPGIEYKKILKEKQSAITTRLFKEIPLPQEQEIEEVVVDKVIHLDDPDKICDNDNDNLVRKEVEKNPGESCNVSNWNDCSGSRNSTDLSEQLDDEDKDDDLELIQLRLLALTSNKKKSKAVNNDCYYNKGNDFNLYGDQKSPDNLKINDDEEDYNKSQDNSSVNNNDPMSTSTYESDIDRYELFLRAEALKTALLKKHQHILKKRKNSRLNAVSHENSDKNLDSYDIDVTETFKIDSDVSQKEVSSLTDEENRLEAQSDLAEVKGLVDKNAESVSNSENDVKMALEEDSKVSPESNSEITSTNLNTCEMDSPVCETLENLEKPVENPSINSNNSGSSYQSGKKKIKRLKWKKNRKLRNSSLSESNIKQNNLTSTNKKDCENLNNLNNKDGDEPGKEFNLFNSLGAPHFQLNDSPSACGAQSLDSELNNKGSIPDKSSGLGLSSVQAVKAPVAEVERIIIHLGSESSEEESSPQHQSNVTEAKTGNASNEGKSSNPDPVDVQKRLNDYEKRVELLLKGARKMIEKKSEVSSRVPPTPEAVYNHLAPSQRLEYMRLKQKIAEREKLSKTNKNASMSSTTEASFKNRNNMISAGMKNVTPSKSQNNIGSNSGLLPNKKIEGRKKEEMPGFNLKPLKKDIGNTSGKKLVRNAPQFGTLGNTGSVSPLSKAVANVRKPGHESRSEKAAVNKLNNVKKQNINVDLRSFIRKGPSVDKNIIERRKMLTQNRLHLERLKVLWKNIKLEKMIEGKYEKEIKRLKLQQNFFELKINQQRLKIKKLAEESKQIYEAFQKNNKRVEVDGKRKKSQSSKEESAQKESVQNEMPKKVEQATPVGKTDDVPKVGEGDPVEQTKNDCTEVEKETGDEKTEKVLVTESNKEQLIVYSSPLEVLSSGYDSVDCPRVDPNIIMCQYDLLGKCNDEECVYQHWRT